MKKLAIVTVNFDGQVDTFDLLNSLKKLDLIGYDVKTIVADNGSDDQSGENIAKEFTEITFLQTGENLGFTGGFNRGLRFALAFGADYVLIINNDIIAPDKNLVKELIKTIDSKESIGIVSPKILFAPGYEFQKENYDEKDQGKIIWYAGGYFDWDNIGSKHRGIDEKDRGQYDKIEESDIASGACLLIKKEVLERAGLFDDNLFAYFDDSDFYQKVRASGFKIYYDGKTHVFHKVSQTAGTGSPATDYYLTRNRLIFGMKYASFRTKFALFREAFKLLLFGRTMQRKGVWDFLLGRVGSLNHQKEGGVFFPKKLSIVFSNYNTAKLAAKLLESIFKKGSGFDENAMEIIMLDDYSPDDPMPQIKKFLPKIQYFKNENNLGFTRSYNRLIHLSAGEYVLVMNTDMAILKDCLTNLIKVEDKFAGSAVLGGRLYFPNMTSQDSVYHFPTIFGAIKEYFFDMKGEYFMYVPCPEVLTRVEGIVGACMFIPRKIFNRIGFLDENLNSYFEDHDLCRRLNRSKVPIYFVPEAKFIHTHGASFAQFGSKTLEIHRASALKFHGKFHYILLYITLWLCQKITRKKPPGSM